jgi:hypothetical protein
MAAYDLANMLNVLCEESVEFIVVGGLAAVLQGAPILTCARAREPLPPSRKAATGLIF